MSTQKKDHNATPTVATRSIREALLLAARLSKGAGIGHIPVHVELGTDRITVTATDRYSIGERTISYWQGEKRRDEPVSAWFSYDELLRWLPAVLPGEVPITITDGKLHLGDVAIPTTTSDGDIEKLRGFFDCERTTPADAGMDAGKVAVAMRWLAKSRETVFDYGIHNGNVIPIWRATGEDVRFVIMSMRRPGNQS